MSSKILQRLLKDPETRNVLEFLGETINPSDLQSLLIETARLRSMKLKPEVLLNEFRKNRFLVPSDIPQNAFNRFDNLALGCLPTGYHPIDLSPVAPLGSCSALTNLSQNLVVSTVRHSEVVAAGRDAGNYKTEMAMLEEHLNFHLKLCKQLDLIKGAEVRLTDFTHKFDTDLMKPALSRLASIFPGAEFVWDNDRTQASNYYKPLAFRIRFFDVKGGEWDLIDGGFTDWTQIYLNNKKERFLSSAIGTELLLRVFPELLETIDLI